MLHDVPAGLSMLKNTHKNEKGHDILSNGNQLVDTRAHYILRIDAEGSVHPMVISLSSTQIKKSKRWMTTMQNIKMQGATGKFTPPMYASIFNITAIAEKNDKGSWMGWNIEHERLVDLSDADEQDWYKAGKAFTDSVMKGEVKTQDLDAAQGATGTEGDLDGEELDK